MYIYNKPQPNKDHCPQLYVVTIEKNGHRYTKFGKTNEASTRFSRYSNGLANASITFVQVWDFPISDEWLTPKVHKAMEQQIHKRLKQTGTSIIPHFKFDGYTECYDLPADDVTKIAEGVIDEYLIHTAKNNWLQEAIAYAATEAAATSSISKTFQ
ncbi:hypothetical protein [Shewanella xiamenensis]|uniref:hypothetical protein n=1 Tax=Shewanella xiamenensis TaxID=332186 RepID=UPI0021BE14F0|nr:hypothetical protein [Shewanella xiamenensis]MCT8876665.1 hypothetical protein [Shewanella xiamenensis]